ncbi:MAG TPA: undecaprenyl-phosphate glucose phosphotransferase [Chlorobium sp.]|nr:undecaprenyl-phosphate glucose phosphotransferase [Chlorobium sp.]
MGHWAREKVVRCLDAFFWIAAAYTAGMLWFGNPLDSVDRIHLLLAYIFPVMAFMILPAMGCYSSWRTLDYHSVIRPVFLGILLVDLSVLVITFLMHEIGSLSRLWFIMTTAMVFAASVVIRIGAIALMRWLRRNGVDLNRVMLIGNEEVMEHVSSLVKGNPGYGFSIARRIPDDTVEEITGLIKENRIDEVWIGSSPEKMKNIERMLLALHDTAIPVRWIPDLKWMTILGYREENLMGCPSVLLNATAIEGSHGRFMKSLFDRVFALVVLIVLSPLLLVIALLVKMSSPGPVFFKQPRQGVSGKAFNCLKFRSMVVHHEEGVVTQATASDSRITNVGNFLRRTSLDELPQFINVLLGDMSIVGPRPHAIKHNELYCKQVDRYMQRHRAKPGITGWAQINGYRGETGTLDKMAKRVEFDLYYMKHWSFMMDLKIIFWTAFRGWTGKNAF